jgi:protein SCO1/2
MPQLWSPPTHELSHTQLTSYSDPMRRLAVALAIILSTSACSRDKRYQLEGQVLAVDTERQELTVKHGDIRGFMPAMTMPFKVRDGRSLHGRKPGELIQATLVVSDSTGRLENIVRTGEAPLPPDAAGVRAAAPLEPGAAVADAEFTDQTGRTRRLSDWRGKTLAVTFVYTRCPLPDFCPLMDRNFAAVQRAVAADQQLAGRVHLLSVSFDPAYDSPKVLAAHAKKAGARPDAWTWLTGEQAAIDSFAAQFGVSIIRDDRPMQEITHNLRTIVIDRAGKIVKIYNGNDWNAEELLATLRAADAT